MKVLSDPPCSYLPIASRSSLTISNCLSTISHNDIAKMDAKLDVLDASLLRNYWSQMQSLEQAGAFITAVAVVVLTYVLYNVCFR